MSLLAGLRPESLPVVAREHFAAVRRARRERGDWGVVVAAATRAGVKLPVVLGRDQRKEAMRERRELARALAALGWSLPRIGRALGRHHTSVLVMLRSVGWP